MVTVVIIFTLCSIIGVSAAFVAYVAGSIIEDNKNDYNLFKSRVETFQDECDGYLEYSMESGVVKTLYTITCSLDNRKTETKIRQHLLENKRKKK
jgi:hypothetical protein